MTDSARKAVVRDLPPPLPAEVFWKAVEPWVRTEPETARTAKHTSYVPVSYTHLTLPTILLV